jgi:hypothetical protein
LLFRQVDRTDRPSGSFQEINMIRTIAAALAAFCLVSFGAFAQGSAGTSTDTGTSAKTETKSDTAGTKSKKHKKHKKAKKDTSAAKTDSSTATPK